MVILVYMSICHTVSDLILEMVLYGSIQVNLKDHLGSELKVPLLSLNLITSLMLPRKKIVSLCFAVIVLL